jgi:hypothetical protein
MPNLSGNYKRIPLGAFLHSKSLTLFEILFSIFRVVDGVDSDTELDVHPANSANIKMKARSVVIHFLFIIDNP